jgi:hypothetical protein
VRQDDPLATVLFGITIQEVAESFVSRQNADNMLLFADDGNVICRAGNPHAALEHLKKSIPHLGLRLNRK